MDSAIALNADGRVVGIMDPAGKIQDKQGKILGCMDPDGLVINSKNESVGMLMPVGGVLDRDDRDFCRLCADAGAVRRP